MSFTFLMNACTSTLRMCLNLSILQRLFNSKTVYLIKTVYFNDTTICSFLKLTIWSCPCCHLFIDSIMVEISSNCCLVYYNLFIFFFAMHMVSPTLITESLMFHHCFIHFTIAYLSSFQSYFNFSVQSIFKATSFYYFG